MKLSDKIVAFMSIKPEFARKLISGEKKYEYRKYPVNEKTTHIIIYSTSPEKTILGIAEIEGIRSDSPTATWERTKHLSGISRRLFREYFKNKDTAYAIEVKNVVAFDNSITIAEIDNSFKVPQSYSYVSEAFMNQVLTKGIKKPSKYRKLIFVGGIHGVGKSTLCLQAVEKFKLCYLSASGLINDYKKNIRSEAEDKGKWVRDIQANQDILIHALNEGSPAFTPCLLDGHFILIDAKGITQVVPESIFKEIDPIEIVVIVDNPAEIAKRLKSRDGIEFDSTILKSMQDLELKQAALVGRSLNIEVHEISCNDSNKFSHILSSFQ